MTNILDNDLTTTEQRLAGTGTAKKRHFHRVIRFWVWATLIALTFATLAYSYEVKQATAERPAFVYQTIHHK